MFLHVGHVAIHEAFEDYNAYA